MALVKLTRPTGNRLLDRLPDSELDALLIDAKVVSFSAREELDTLGRDGQPIYFPQSGVFSLLLPMLDGSPVEVSVVDSEGMLGIPAAFGMPTNPLRAVTQTPGDCIQIPLERFMAILRQGGALDHLVRRFLAISWQAANQTIACNLRHSVKERTCRWLLSVHDRSETDEFVVTQEILSGMVGSSRQKITMVAGELQAAGFIRYNRGRIRVLDRPGLEKTSCECYGVLRQAFKILIS